MDYITACDILAKSMTRTSCSPLASVTVRIERRSRSVPSSASANRRGQRLQREQMSWVEAAFYTVKSVETRHLIPPRNVLSDCLQLGTMGLEHGKRYIGLHPAPFQNAQLIPRRRSSESRCTCDRRLTSYSESGGPLIRNV